MENLIGQRIKERRKELNITQSKIQEETSISSGNLSCIENGKYLPSATALLELSQILDCSVDWILTGETSHEILDIKERALLDKFRELPFEEQDEILTLLHMKYQKIQRKRTENPKSSTSTELSAG